MAANRKLFITHAGELAHKFVRAVKRDGMVIEFVRSYAGRYKRGKLIMDQRRLRELEVTIGREVLLVMAVEVKRLLPGVFGTGRAGALRPDEAILSQAFYAEFIASLERAMDWSEQEISAERQAFHRDLDMYSRWRERPSMLRDKSPYSMSPFPDRCAILLDPAMMEQARRAGAAFETEVERTGYRILNQLGRITPSRARRPPRRAAKPGRKPQRRLSAKPKPGPRRRKRLQRDPLKPRKRK